MLSNSYLENLRKVYKKIPILHSTLIKIACSQKILLLKMKIIINEIVHVISSNLDLVIPPQTGASFY